MMQTDIQIVYPSPITNGRGFTMRGRVYAYGPPCPKCGKQWDIIKDPVTRDILNILCRECYTCPIRFAVDGRAFKNRKGSVGRLFRDEKGELLYSFYAAKQLLEAIRHDWVKEEERFDPAKWSRSGRETYKLSECSREWILHLEKRKPPVSRTHIEHMQRFFDKHINPFMGDLDIREITPDDIEKFQADLSEKGYKQNTLRTVLGALRTLLKRYCDRKMILNRVPPFPEKWSATPHIERYIVKDESIQRQMWERMPGDTHLLMETLCALGCRPSEVCGLRKKDLMPDGTILIQRSINVYGQETSVKTGKSRSHRIPESLHNRLSQLPVLPGGYLFTRDGRPNNPRRLSGEFRAANRECPQITLYTFSRHSFASRVAREAKEEGIKEAARRIGNTAQIAKLHYVQE